MLIQAAGHGLLRLSDNRTNAVVKPTTEVEARMYEHFRDDPNLDAIRPLVPRLYSVSRVEPDPTRPTYTHEIEIENLCVLDSMSSDEDPSTTDDSQPSSIGNLGGRDGEVPTDSPSTLLVGDASSSAPGSRTFPSAAAEPKSEQRSSSGGKRTQWH